MTKASMTLSSIDCSPLADASNAIVSTRQWRRLVTRRRRERRGIILIFVVVLLMLLAIMGTAYLAASKADRVAIKGNGAIAGTESPRLADRANLDNLFEAAQKRVQNALIEDLFNLPPGDLVQLQRDADKGATNNAVAARATIFSTFRETDAPPGVQPAGAASTADDFNHYYYNYDAPGRADPYLSSLLPIRLPAAAGNVPANTIVWPWIGAPLPGEILPGKQIAPFFTDPRFLARSATTGFTPGFTTAYVRLPDDTERNAETDFNPVTNPVHLTWVAGRQNVVPSAFPLLRSDSAAAGTPADRQTTRVYPGFDYYAPGGTVGQKVIAGDADGDGIADGGLAPIIFNPNATGFNKYIDSANGVVYFVSYRVVDNSAKINVNTALTSRNDFAFPNGGTPTAAISTRMLSLTPDAPPVGPDQPNLGFFKSNLGLIELVRNTVNTIDTGSSGLANAEITRLLGARIPSLGGTNAQETNPNSTTDSVWRRFGFANDPANPSTPAGQVLAFYGEGYKNIYTPTAQNPVTDFYYRFTTFGDSLEQLLARRPDSVGPVRTAVAQKMTSGALVSLPAADTISFSTGGGSLLNDQLTSAITENALLLSTRMSSANFATTTDGTWKWFPAGEVNLWFGWTKDFSMALSPAPILTTPEAAAGTAYALALLDGDNAFATRLFQYTPPASSGVPSRLDMSRSIRPLLTTRNGVTSAVPMRYDGTDVPPGMPGYGPMDATLAKYPAEVVSASTGTKEQLWRAYWSAMTLNRAQGPTPAVRVWAKKNLYDPDPASITGKFNFDSAAVLDDPYYKAYDAFLPPDRHYSTLPPSRRAPIPPGGQVQSRLDENQMALLRSAIAACNTVDLRDADDDVTAMTIDLGYARAYNLLDPANPLFPGNTSTAQRSKIYARVYGTERQLVISSVVVDRDAGGTVFVAVELFNPTDRPLRLDGYHVAVMNRGEPAAVDLETAYVYVDNPTGDPGYIPDASMTSAAANGRHDPSIDPTMIVPTGARAAAGGTTLAPGGFVVITNGVAVPANVTLPAATVPALPTVPTPYAPNDVSNTAEPPSAAAVPTQVIVADPMPILSRLLGRDSAGNLTCELALFRTRRADGVEYRDHLYPPAAGGTTTPGMETNTTYRRPTMNEDLTTVQGISTLVPIDAVDCRSLDQRPNIAGSPTRPPLAPPGPAQYLYVRATTPYQRFTPNADAWKCFYAGRFYDPRPFRNSQKPPLIPPTGTPTPAVLPQIEPLSPPLLNWAWQPFPAAPPAIVLGAYHPTAGAAVTVTPFLSPTIPIQNQTPYTQFDPSVVPPVTYNPSVTVPRTDVDHPPFQFPYGTPFARNGDLMQVPFIGSYKIYRVQIDGAQTTGGTNPTPAFRILPPDVPAAPGAAGSPPPAAPNRALYEYVPITMDAVNVAPDPVEWTTLVAAPPTREYSNPSVGRFDPREDIYPRNDWAADVYNYVVAHKTSSPDIAFPDIPTSPPPTATAYFNNPMQPATDQDGPILSIGDDPTIPAPAALPPAVGATANAQKRVPWIEWRSDAATGPQPKTPASYSRSADAPLATTSEPQSKLIPGTVNLNTAPPIVLRMLPWTVDPDTGFMDQVGVNSAAALRTNAIQRQRTGALTYFQTSADPDITPPLVAGNNVPYGRQARPYKYGPFGYSSIFSLSSLPYFAANDTRFLPITDAASVGPWSHTTNQQLMRMGLLNPQHRGDNETDFNIHHLNATRVSNMATTRSDCFTVYVTVQAWTYVGNDTKQLTDTRLVGERRGSFVVDRSRISQTAYKPSDLIVYPVEQE